MQRITVKKTLPYETQSGLGVPFCTQPAPLPGTDLLEHAVLLVEVVGRHVHVGERHLHRVLDGVQQLHHHVRDVLEGELAPLGGPDGRPHLKRVKEQRLKACRSSAASDTGDLASRTHTLPLAGSPDHGTGGHEGSTAAPTGARTRRHRRQRRSNSV